MAEIETTANVVPLNPTPAKFKPREASAKRTGGNRQRRRGLTSPQPVAAPETTAATDSIARSQLRIHGVQRDGAPSRVLAVTVFGVGLVTAAVGLYLNASFLWKFGRTSESGLVLAVIGLVTDTITLVLPAT